MPARRLAALAAPWILLLGLTRGVVTLPERCPPATADRARAAAVEAVGWFERNQRADGHWVYRYDRDADEVNRQDHVVRQAGITLSLYQAHAAGIAGALEPADEGVDWLLGELVRHDDWAAVERGGLAPTGGTALLVAALSTRRAATDDPRFDTELEDLGRFLAAMTEPSGAVAANWDVGRGRPVPAQYSQYFTGEAYFARALLATVDPGGGWDVTAARIGDYLTDRDDTEDRFPPTTDHWAAYGLAQTALEVGQPLDADQSAYAERLAGLFSVEVRFESQRTGHGLNYSVLRGPNVVGAGLGTIGEGLGSLWRLSAADHGLAGDRGAISERLRCVAGMLVDRQVTAAEAAESGHPGLARGAWFYKDLTQMDDQQHSLSALLLAEPALAEEGAAAGGRCEPGDRPDRGRAGGGAGGGCRRRPPTKRTVPRRRARPRAAGSSADTGPPASVSGIAGARRDRRRRMGRRRGRRRRGGGRRCAGAVALIRRRPSRLGRCARRGGALGRGGPGDPRGDRPGGARRPGRVRCAPLSNRRRSVPVLATDERWIGGSPRRRRVQAGPGTSCSRAPSGSMTSRISSSSPGVGSRDCGTSAGTASSNAVAATTSSRVTPGWSERNRIERSRVSKSKTPRLDTTRRTSTNRPAGPSAAARSQPTPVTVSTFSTNTLGPWLGTQ